MTASPLKTKLLEITQIGSSRAGVLDIQEKYWPKPGQYLSCQKFTEIPDVLTTNLFSILGNKGVLTLEPIPQNWTPGDQVQYLAPQGLAFQLPSSARRVGLLPFGVSPLRLLTLVRPALAQGASLILFLDPEQRDTFLSFVPSSLEVLPLSALKDNLDWLDTLAVDIKREDLDVLSNLFLGLTLSITGEVLIRTVMPCHGIGECGVCSVKTKHGWRLACKDGPVFRLAEILHVAQ